MMSNVTAPGRPPPPLPKLPTPQAKKLPPLPVSSCPTSPPPPSPKPPSRPPPKVRPEAKGAAVKSNSLRGLKGTLRNIRNVQEQLDQQGDIADVQQSNLEPESEPEKTSIRPNKIRPKDDVNHNATPNSTFRKKKKRKAAEAKISERGVLSTISRWETATDENDTEALVLNTRQRHTCALARSKLIIYGGCTNKATEPPHTILIYDFTKQKWSTPNPEYVSKPGGVPPARRSSIECRYSHASVWYNDAMYIFGGVAFSSTNVGVITNTTLWYHPQQNQWTLLDTSGKIPAKRKGHGAALLGKYMYIFGGMTEANQALNDLYRLDLETLQWTLITTVGQQPPPRYYFGFTSTQEALYLFGGYNGHSELSDLYSYRPETNSWTFELPRQGIPPPTKQGHTLTGTGTHLYMVGGSNSENEDRLDTFVYSLELQMWAVVPYELPPNEKIPEKHNRLFHSAVANPYASTQQLLLFGGSNPQNSSILNSITFYVDVGVSSTDDIAALYRLPRGDWEAVAMSLHPDVLELRERLRAITQQQTYGRMRANLAAKTQLSCSLSSTQVLQLVMEWLLNKGYSETFSLLQSETGETYIKQFNNYSNNTSLDLLLSLAKRRLRNENVWSPEALAIAREDANVVEVVDHLPGFNAEAIMALRMDIWDEDVIPNTNLKLDGATIIGGTLNSLIQVLSDYDGYVEHSTQQSADEFRRLFFMTLNSFSTPDVVLTKIIQLYDVPDELDEIDVSSHQVSVIGLIKYWIELCAGWDWSSDKLRAKLLKFIEGPMTLTGQVFEVRELKQLLNKTLAKPTVQRDDLSAIGRWKEQVEKGSHELSDAPEPIVPKTIFSPKLELDDVHELEIARQLTILYFDILKRIKPPELCRRWWNTDDADYRSPHIRAFIKRSTQIKRWVLSTSSQDDKRLRRSVERYVKIAEHLRALNNFETCFTLLSALQSPLFASCMAPYKKQIEPMVKLMESANTADGKNDLYFTTIQRIVEAKQPVIPYIKFWLNQLERLELTEPDFLENGMINLQKCRVLLQIMDQLKMMQETPYKLLPVYQIASLLKMETLAADDVDAPSATMEAMSRD